MSRAGDPEERRLYLPDGRYYVVPSWASEEDIENFRRDNPEVLDDPDLAGSIWEGIKNVPKGALGTLATMGTGITALLPGDTGAQGALLQAQKRIRDSTDPRYHDSYIAQFGQGLGSAGIFAGIGLLTGGTGAGAALGGRAAMAGMGAAGALGGVGEHAERRAMAAESGLNVTAADALLSTIGGTIVGASEALPFRRLLGPVVGEAAEDAIQKGLSGVKRSFGDRLTSAAQQGLEEGIQEYLAGSAQNTIAAYTYDPEAKKAADPRDFTVGFGVGAFMDVAARALAGGYNSLARVADREREMGLRKDKLGDIEESVGRETQPEVEEEIEQAGGWQPIQHNYNALRQPDGVFDIINEEGDVVSRGITDEESATEAINILKERDVAKATWGGVYLQLRNQGLHQDSIARALGMLIRNPSTNHIPVEDVANYLKPDEHGAHDLTVSRRSVERLKQSRALDQWVKGGRSFISFEEIHSLLNPEQLNRFYEDQIMIGADELAKMNRDHMSIVNPKTGRVKVGSIKRMDLMNRKIKRLAKKTRDMLAGLTSQGNVFNAQQDKVSVSDLEGVIKDKGWLLPKGGLNSNEGNALKMALVGTTKLNNPRTTQLMAVRLAGLPARTGNPITIPDFTRIQYTQEQIDRAVNVLGEDGGTVDLKQFRELMDMQVPHFDQMLRHLIRSGAVKKSGPNSSPKLQFVPEVDRLVEDLREEADVIAGKGVGMKTPVYFEDTLRAVRDQRANEENVAPEEIDAQEGSPRQKAEFIEGTQIAVGDFMERLNTWMKERGMDPNTVDTETSMADIVKNTVHAIVGGRMPSAAFVDPQDAMAKIVLNTAAHVANDPDITLDERKVGDEVKPGLMDLVERDMYYEGTRWFRHHDMFTADQWESMKQMARVSIIPEGLDGEGMTFYDWAVANMGAETLGSQAPLDLDRQGTTEAVLETAVARNMEEFGAGTWVPPTTKGKSIFKKVFESYRDMVGLGNDPSLAAAMSVFNQMKSGQLGHTVEPGMSALDEEGPVRSQLLIDREVTSPEVEDAQEELNDDPNRVPHVGDFAGPEAINVYYNNRDDSGNLSPNVRFRYGRKNNLAKPRFLPEGQKSPTSYKPDDRTMGETLFDALKNKEFEEHPKKMWDKMWKQFYQKVVDTRHGVDLMTERVRKMKKDAGEMYREMMADQSAIAAFRFRDASMHYVKSALTRGKLNYTGEDALRGHYLVEDLVDEDGRTYKGLAEGFQLLDTGDVNDEINADHYVIAKRVVNLHARNHKSKARQPGDMSLANAQAIIQNVESDPTADHIVKFGKMIKAWNNSLIELAMGTELLSREQAEEWLDNMYVPFYKSHEMDQQRRDAESLRRRSQRKKGDVRATKRSKLEVELDGSVDPIDIDLVSRYVSNAETIIQDAMINVAYRRVSRDLLSLGEAKVVEGTAPNAIRYLENGEEKFIQADDPWLVQAALSSGENMLEPIVQFLGAGPANILRESVTRNPAFIVRNLTRDTLSAAVTSGSDFVPFRDTLRKFNKADYEMAEKLGIAMDHDFVNDPTRYRKQMQKLIKREYADDNPVKKQFFKIWDGLGDYSRMSDSATRMAVYEDVMNKTGNQAEAIYQAMEIINFGRRGNSPIWRAFSSSIPFLNARVQGFDVFARAMTGRYTANPDLAGDPQKIRNQFLLRGVLLGSATALYYASVHDKDWYKNQRDEIKDDYWLIPVGGGVLASVPVPFEVGLMFKTFPEQAMRLATEEGYTKSRAAKSAGRALTQTANFQYTPQLLAPLMDVLVNRNSFTGQPIVPSYMLEGMPREGQRDFNTNEAIAMLAEATGMSPMKLEYLVNGYLGPLASYVAIVADKAARIETMRDAVEGVVPWMDLQDLPTTGAAGTRQDIVNPLTDFRSSVRSAPILRQLFRDAGAGGGYQQEFYGLRTQVDRAVAKINQAQRERRFEDMRDARHEESALLRVRDTVNTLDRYMAAWRKRRDRVLMSRRYDPEGKRERIHKLEAERDRQLAIVPFLLKTIDEAQ